MYVYFNKIIFSTPIVIHILKEDRKLIYGHMAGMLRKWKSLSFAWKIMPVIGFK